MEIASRIVTDKPIGFSEKISKKKPPIPADIIPYFPSVLSKRLIITGTIKRKLKKGAVILKWTKKLVCSKAKK
jgi:hypothetical protein